MRIMFIIVNGILGDIILHCCTAEADEKGAEHDFKESVKIIGYFRR